MKNWLLTIGLLTEVALVAFLAYAPPLRVVFKTEPIAFKHWCPPIAFGVYILVIDEARKFVLRGHSKLSVVAEEFTYY